MARAALSLFRSLKDRFDIQTVLRGFVLANAPDFIDDGVPRQDLISHLELGSSWRKSPRPKIGGWPISRRTSASTPFIDVVQPRTASRFDIIR